MQELKPTHFPPSHLPWIPQKRCLRGQMVFMSSLWIWMQTEGESLVQAHYFLNGTYVCHTILERL